MKYRITFRGIGNSSSSIEGRTENDFESVKSDVAKVLTQGGHLSFALDGNNATFVHSDFIRSKIVTVEEVVE